MKKKQIAILGSTGSIGTQALEVIAEHADLYEVYCLTANNKVELLAQQAHQFKPAAIVIANEQRYDELKSLMSDLPDVKVYAGRQALERLLPWLTRRRWLLPENSFSNWHRSTTPLSYPSTASTQPFSRVSSARTTTP